MQSFLQFKRVGQAAQERVRRAQEVAPQQEKSPAVATRTDGYTIAEDEGQAEAEAETDAEKTESGDDDDDISEPAMDIPTLVRSLPEVVREASNAAGGDEVFVVGFEGPDDPMNPRNWSNSRRLGVMLLISFIAMGVGIASGIDSTILPQAAKEFGVSQVVESVAIGVYLVGIGLGSLVAGPFSETFGRNVVYCGSMVVFMIWIMAAGLSPNIGAQIVFRLLAGSASSAPMVCTGGTVADMFNSLEKTWAFPAYAAVAFGGPMLGAVMGAYIGPSSLSWRWVEWVVLLFSALILVSILLFMPETYAPLLLQWKAEHLRRITGETRFRSAHEIADATLLSRLKVSMTRPFLMLTEPIVIAFALYLSVLYIVLFTFLVGWPFIFEQTYSLGQGLSHIIFLSMFIGVWTVTFLLPFIYNKTARTIRLAESRGEGESKPAKFSPEIRLWFGMAGPAVAVPVSLFWMGWTAYPHVSIWSPILAAALFGFGVTGVFICAYMYVIDSYETYSASALTFVTLTRYIIAGGMTVVGIPFYQNMGTHYTLTIMASISVALVPIPYLLYFYGYWLRKKSRYAVSWDS